ncbi:hypothetical protein [Colwellia psychrerythraea]|nr:hypothetical protein [Colwellia psychrerythraea]
MAKCPSLTYFMPRYLLLLLSLIITPIAAEQRAKIPITIETDIYQLAQKKIAEHEVLDIKDFSGPNLPRDVVEFILIQQALALGGSKLEFSFTVGNYDARNIKLLQSGLLLINFDSMWLSQISSFSEEVYISDAIIRKGEYWAGLYTALDNKMALETKSLIDLQSLSVVSNKNWYVDWKTLTQLNIKTLIHDEEWLSMAKLVSMQWVDVMLAPFTESYPFSYQGDGYRIIAINGIKVALNDSRHFVISKKHPRGKETYIALQKGLRLLRQRGAISKAFLQSGFFNDRVKEWHVINQDFLESKSNIDKTY